MTMIRNIIFDIGNVLVDYCWREHIAVCGYTGETAKRLGRAMMQSPVWPELDRGVWSEEELLGGFIQNDPELEHEIRHVFADLSTLVRLYPRTDAWLEALRAKGYKVYYLSNFSDKCRREAIKQLGFMERMDGGLMSYEVREIKPCERIFRLLLERYDLKPEESIFLDDTSANLETARRLGMRTIQVESQEQAMRELDKALKEA